MRRTLSHGEAVTGGGLFVVTGTITEVKSAAGARLGFVVERLNGDWTVISHGASCGGTYTTRDRAVGQLATSCGY